ncbi:MAG: ABC transporter permease [Andreesenia angusta]|nr:ABC transporter permease [Andreesenia angusta]
MREKSIKLTTYLFFTISILLIVFPFVYLIIEGLNLVPNLIRTEEVLFSIKLSMKTTSISSIIVMVIAIPTSIFLSSTESRLKRFFELILYIPMSLPHLVAGLALLYFFGQTPIGNYLSNKLNLDFIFTVQGIIIAQVFVNLPLALKNLIDFLRKIDTEYYLVAKSYGADEWQIMKYVILPMMKKDILSTSLIVWYRAIGEFGAIMMLVGTTRFKTELIPTAIFLNMSTGDIDIAIALSVILILLSAMVISIYNLLGKSIE